MTETNGHTKIEKIADGVWSRLIARGAIIVTAGLAPFAFNTVSGWIDELRAGQKEQIQAVGAVVDKLTEIKLKMTGVDGRLDRIEAVQTQRDGEQDRRLDTTESRLDSHDKRLNWLNRPSPSP